MRVNETAMTMVAAAAQRRARADGLVVRLTAEECRWFGPDGKSDAATFASEPMPFPLATESRLARRFPRGGLLRTAVVTTRALMDIAAAL
jgi:hypothetical protein